MRAFAPRTVLSTQLTHGKRVGADLQAHQRDMSGGVQLEKYTTLPTQSASPFHAAVYERKISRLARATAGEAAAKPFDTLPQGRPRLSPFLPSPNASPFAAAVHDLKLERMMSSLRKEARKTQEQESDTTARTSPAYFWKPPGAGNRDSFAFTR